MKQYFIFFCVAVLFQCTQKERGHESEKASLFILKDSTHTGINFQNTLTYDEDFNVYTYRNYYNGGGVAIGDIDNDGLVDIYFTSNLAQNKLYRNLGNFQFQDITIQAGVGGSKAWSTGVTMVDINADGLLDIYVCNSGDIAGDNKQNELFINQGNMSFTEEAEKYGLDDHGFSTHASFFDYDKDGDLDAYILNNSYQAIGSFNLRRNERPKRDAAGGDKLMENRDGRFVDISESAGIYGSIIGFGLGVTVGDVNGDLWDDIYVSNDFFERDYLYINQQDGTFKEDLTTQMKSISAASMGADMADINNDGYNDLFVTEMLPSKEERLKSVTTFEDWNRYQYNLENGYYHQFTRNTFQLNNANGRFTEIGRLAGVEASDWSWGALIFDFENDGLKDLFIANGIYQDLTNQDYLQYVSNEEVVKSVVTKNKVDYKKLIDLIPSNPIENLAFRNQGGLSFVEMGAEYGLDQPGFSNGSAYGDLDNDGDLDLVVNNVNMPSFVYENTTNTQKPGNFLKLILKGNAPNTFGIGAKITIESGDESYYLEAQPTRGFQSSVDPRPHVGLKTGDPVDVTVIWPTGKMSKLSGVEPNQTITVEEKEASASNVSERIFEEIFRPATPTVPYVHEENKFVDFHRDRLLYHMNSTEGPNMSSGDVNGDGLPDIYIGGAKGFAGSLLIRQPIGFKAAESDVFELDKISEDRESVFFDADGDGDLDLYVCSGGSEFSSSSSALLDRLYLNNGQASFDKSDQPLPVSGAYISSATVSASDIDGDGDIDLFVGERLKPLAYGVSCGGFLLSNNGSAIFTNVTAEVAPELSSLGMITCSEFIDLDADGDDDLVIAGEFMPATIFKNEDGKFIPVSQTGLQDLTGWWSSLHTTDLDGDGDKDLILGNHGQNSRFRASEERPITLYLSDFDGNGFVDPILTYRSSEGKDYPFALRHNLIDQIKELKKQFPDYESYKDADMIRIFSAEKLSRARSIQVNTLVSMVAINEGDFKFSIMELPVEAQLAPVFAISSADFDKDGDQDLILGGNLYATKPEVGRYDASQGAYLENQGNGTFRGFNGKMGFYIDGEVRDFLVFEDEVIVSRNSDSLLIFNY